MSGYQKGHPTSLIDIREWFETHDIPVSCAVAALRGLKKKGYATQRRFAGVWVPLKDLDGVAVRVAVIYGVKEVMV